MKRIKALIALISVCLTLAFAFVNSEIVASASTPYVPDDFASYRIKSSADLTDDSVPISVVFVNGIIYAGQNSVYYDFWGLVILKRKVLFVCDGAQIEAAEYGGEEDYTYRYCDTYAFSSSNANGFISTNRLELEIPMYFFSQDSGTLEIWYENKYESEEMPYELETYRLYPIKYEKRDGRIYFTQETERRW